MRSSHPELPRRVIADQPWSRWRPRLACLLVGLVTLTGCAAGPDTPGSGRNHVSTEQNVGMQEPVRIPGVGSCHLVSRLAIPAQSGARYEVPSVQLPCLTRGPSVDLSLIRGKPILVNLWASWCGPCRKEMPILQTAYERFGQRVQFVGVDTSDSAEAAAAFLKNVGVSYPQLADSGAMLLEHLRIPGLPVTVLIGADGSVSARHVGGFQGKDLDVLLDHVTRR